MRRAASSTLTRSGSAGARTRFGGFAEILACTLTWASISPIVQSIEARASLIVLFRVGVGALVVLAYAAMRGRIGELKPRGSAGLLVASGLTLAVHWAMLFETYKRLEVAPAVALAFIGPVLGAVAAPFVLREPLRARRVVALAVAVLGLAAITVPEIRSLDALGVAFGLLSAATFGALLIMGRVLSRTETPLAINAWQLGIATVPMLLVLRGGTQGLSAGWPVLVMLGAVHTGIAGILFFRAVAALEAHQLATMFYVEPAAAVVIAWIALEQTPTPWMLTGFALVVGAGLLLVSERVLPPVAPLASPETLPMEDP